MSDREDLARIIDPKSWREADRGAGRPKLTKGEFFPPAAEWAATQDSLSKAEAILSLLGSRLAKEGEVVVPQEPTEAMIAADGVDCGPKTALKAYRAMIAASPKDIPNA